MSVFGTRRLKHSMFFVCGTVHFYVLCMYEYRIDIYIQYIFRFIVLEQILAYSGPISKKAIKPFI